MAGCKNFARGWCRLVVECRLLGPVDYPTCASSGCRNHRESAPITPLFDTLPGPQHPAAISLCLLSCRFLACCITALLFGPPSGYGVKMILYFLWSVGHRTRHIRMALEDLFDLFRYGENGFGNCNCFLIQVDWESKRGIRDCHETSSRRRRGGGKAIGT